jgi:hypothetical protein
MSQSNDSNWSEANQRYLIAALAVVRQALQRDVARAVQPVVEGAVTETCAAPEGAGETPALQGADPALHHDETSAPNTNALRAQLDEMARSMAPPPALDRLCQALGLSSFERDLLLLCAGMELDAAFARLFAAVAGDPERAYPTFGLALAVLANPHWSAVSPAGPLRRWRLIELGSATSLVRCPVRIDECVLHFLTGITVLDPRLVGLVEPLQAAEELAPSHQTIVERVRATWARAQQDALLPVIQLYGEDVLGKRAIAATALRAVGASVNLLPASSLPTDPAELESFMRLWERQAIFDGSVLLLEIDTPESSDSALQRAAHHFIESTDAALIVSSRERRRPPHARPLVTLEVKKPAPSEQHAAWLNVLGSAAPVLDGKVEALVSQFSLTLPAIRTAGREALARVQADGAGSCLLPSLVKEGNYKPASPVLGNGASSGLLPSLVKEGVGGGCSGDSPPPDPLLIRGGEPRPPDLASALWDACRVQTRPPLADLAQHIDAMATWDDLVLPDRQKQILREIAVHARQRTKVYEQWGFASKGRRGLGISALFAGSTGTGKTMAAEVLANDLLLDLYRIDLSSVVSKYIGETEKNLRRVFDAAEDGGAILLFDEADALFGKRSEVKDSHDRYANIEISYLLQRMESYRGLAILTTNMKSALDPAFMRRIRFVVQFPFPDPAQRAEIWRRIFPRQTPQDGLDVERLARLDVAGGNIRNIALNAAFLAAESGEAVRMAHLLSATRSEYTKLEKSLSEAEIRGWV